jgi:maleate isomerase
MNDAGSLESRMSLSAHQAARSRLYGHRARIGYTSPPLFTEVFPYEFYRIVPDGVTLVLTTVGVIQPDKANINQAYENTMTAARAIARSGVDVVVLGGQPINMARGAENADKVIRDLEVELGVKVSTSAAAQKKAALALGCRKVVIAQPYGPEENARQSGYAVAWGCEVLGVTGWGSTLAEFGSIPRDAALLMGRALLRQHPEADSILLPSPNWPTIDAIEPLEQEFGVRVMTASQAAIWDALRLAGIIDRITGYGRLLAEF